MSALFWSHWHRSDDFKKVSDSSFFRGVPFREIFYRGMRALFKDESGANGALYQGKVFRAALIVIASNNGNRSGFEQGDLQKMLLQGDFDYNNGGSGGWATDHRLEIENLDDPAKVGHTPWGIGTRREAQINVARLIADASTFTVGETDDDATSLLAFYSASVVLHEMMHGHGFKHPDGPEVESQGAAYTVSLPNIAKLAALGATGRWDVFGGPKLNKYNQVPGYAGLNFFATKKPPFWRAPSPLGGTDPKVGTLGAAALSDCVYLDLFGQRRLPGTNLKPHMVQRWWDGTKWNPADWTTYADAADITLSGDPAVASWDNTHRSVFARGNNGSVWHKYWLNGKWSKWIDFGGQVTDEIGAVAVPNSQIIDLYVRGSNGLLWQGIWRGLDTPPKWEQRSAQPIASGPSVIARATNERHVFARLPNGTVGVLRWDGKSWHDWANLGGQILGRPSAIALQDTASIAVYVRGTDHRLWERWWDGAAWNPDWVPHDDGVEVVSSPAAVSLHHANREVFYFAGPNGTVMRKRWNP